MKKEHATKEGELLNLEKLLVKLYFYNMDDRFSRFGFEV